jgi:uncharacterized protein (TIGR04255 family)
MTAEQTFHLPHAPIIEAVVDIDCDLPVGIDLPAMEGRIRQHFSNEYPRFRRQMIQQHAMKASLDAPPEFSVQSSLRAFQFLKEDERQLVQVRTEGFSFNRLEPYSSFDEYLPEIERAWKRFAEVMAPVQIRRIVLRYINRIFLPTSDGLVDIGNYLRLNFKLPDETGLELSGFFNQYSATEAETGHQVNVSMVAQPVEGDRLPVVFDIEAIHPAPADPESWENIRATILLLRRLKNRIFARTLTEQCLNLFR